MNVLVVEDDEVFRFALEAILRSHDVEPTLCATAAEARRQLARRSFDAALVDLRLPDQDGVALIREIANGPHATATICLTGSDRPESVVAAMRAGATDYLVKPVPASQLLDALRGAAGAATRRGVRPSPTPPLGQSPAWLDVLDLVERVAAAPRAKVLLTGESGAGKDVIAHYLHARSDRADSPCIAVNCACLSNELVEAELFGHEAGSFTGARARRRGMLELADKGTLFLDEIGELPMPMQAKLLRVLEERKFRRVGGEQEIDVDVRFIFATNQPLRERAQSGLFRWDLYQRIAVFEIELPALRERTGDVECLISGLLPGIAQQLGIRTPSIDASAWPEMAAHSWPGNVRELRNFLERAVVMSAGNIDRHLVHRLLGRPAGLRAACQSLAPAPCPYEAELPLALEDAVRAHCERTLRWAGGNVSAAARQLGISRGALRRHLAPASSDVPDDVAPE